MEIISYIEKHFWQLFRYGAVSVVTISFFIGLNYLFIDILKMNPRIGYLCASSIAYIFLFISSTNFIFKQKVNANNTKYFILYILIFWSLNNIFFNIIYSITHWNYLIITVLNMFIFFPLRFYSQKYLVFKDY